MADARRGIWQASDPNAQMSANFRTAEQQRPRKVQSARGENQRHLPALPTARHMPLPTARVTPHSARCAVAQVVGNASRRSPSEHRHGYPSEQESSCRTSDVVADESKATQRTPRKPAVGDSATAKPGTQTRLSDGTILEAGQTAKIISVNEAGDILLRNNHTGAMSSFVPSTNYVCTSNDSSTNGLPDAAEVQEDRVLPTKMDVALKDMFSLLVVENWHNEPDKDQAFESTLLQCESRLRRLQRLAAKLPPPNACITAVAFDVLQGTIETLPRVLRNVCSTLVGYITEAVYSPDKMEHSDLVELKAHVSERMERAPWFLTARKQQDRLEGIEDHIFSMQHLVNVHLKRRRKVLAFIIRLQYSERLELQKWIFHFWKIISFQRRDRMRKLLGISAAPTTSVNTPFMLWRLYVCQERLSFVSNQCNVITAEAHVISTRITESEMENERSQKRVVESAQKAAILKAECAEAEAEQHRLQTLWDAMQPELLLSTLLELLAVFFKLLVETAHFSRVDVRLRFGGKDAKGLLEGLAPRRGSYNEARAFSSEELLLRWINLALARARKDATELLEGEKPLPATERTWLEVARQKHDCVNLAEDLCDSVALCMLFALLKAVARGRATLCASDLHPLEERDLNMRATSFLHVLNSFAPDLRTRCLLVASDIVKGRKDIIIPLLAQAFLLEPLLEDTPEEKAEKNAHGSSLAPETSEVKSVVVVNATKAKLQEIGGMPQKELQSKSGKNCMTDLREIGFYACNQQLEAVLCTMEQAARVHERNAIVDPSQLLHAGEDFHLLATFTAEQLLLRWVNTTICDMHLKPIENFGPDLEDGAVLRHLLSMVAAEVCPQTWSTDSEELLREVTSVASRCTSFELLTVDAITEAHSDVLAVFLAQLFVNRPHLKAHTRSLMHMHVEFLETTCQEGFEILRTPDDTKLVMGFCRRLSAGWSEVTLALGALKEASQTLQSLQTCLRSFSGETLAARASGRPRAMLDTKEERELMQYASLSRDRIQHLLNISADPHAFDRTEELLRKHFRLLRDVFKFYATQDKRSSGISLDGLLKLYRECKLRSKDLAAHHLEAIFYYNIESNHAESSMQLSPQSFIDVLLEFAMLKYGSVIDSLPNQLWHLIENNIKPYACQDDQSSFHNMAYDPKVREVLDSHSKELKVIFRIYAMADVSSGEAMQKVSTMNVKEFYLLLDDCELLDSTLTKSAVQQIFEGIQQTGEDVVDGDGEVILARQVSLGLDDDDELAFSEFIDALVAVAAYKFPDPFTPLFVRVNSFITTLFGALRHHWSRKRLSPHVDSMLNMLHKKLLSV